MLIAILTLINAIIISVLSFKLGKSRAENMMLWAKLDTLKLHGWETIGERRERLKHQKLFKVWLN